MFTLALVVLAALLAFALWHVLASFRDGEAGDASTYEQTERRSMPASIANGRLLYSETYFRTARPRRVGARVDQVFATHTGVAVVETKHRYRKRWTRYDQIELSGQAMVLNRSRPDALKALGERGVVNQAWVRLVAPGRTPTYLPVPLLTEEQLVACVDRYHALMRGQVAPAGAAEPAQCGKCAFRPRCPQARR